MQGYTEEEKFMLRCLDLALLGKGKVAPNPLVGAVIVHDNLIIGEGFHRNYGQAHAEVNAINNVVNPSLLEKSTLYVNLEPCSHFGKTPPCANLIIEKKIPRVVIGTSDPNTLVSGKGINLLRQNGISVTEGVLAGKCQEVNRRFFTWHLHKRPYIILKWARSADGYIDLIRSANAPIGPNWITSRQARILVHKWRAEEQAILVGTNTVLKDNPRLNIRDWKGNDPLRVVIDRSQKIGDNYNVLDETQETIVFTEQLSSEKRKGGKTNISGRQSVDKTSDTRERIKSGKSKVSYVPINFNETAEVQIMKHLYQQNIQSLIIEGGAFTLKKFIDKGLWDEARIFTGPALFKDGIKSPEISGASGYSGMIGNSELLVLYNIHMVCFRSGNQGSDYQNKPT